MTIFICSASTCDDVSLLLNKVDKFSNENDQLKEINHLKGKQSQPEMSAEKEDTHISSVQERKKDPSPENKQSKENNHQNSTELRAWVQTRQRDVSFQAKNMMVIVVPTARKLSVNVLDDISDRVSLIVEILSFPYLIMTILCSQAECDTS